MFAASSRPASKRPAPLVCRKSGGQVALLYGHRLFDINELNRCHSRGSTIFSCNPSTISIDAFQKAASFDVFSDMGSQHSELAKVHHIMLSLPLAGSAE